MKLRLLCWKTSRTAQSVLVVVGIAASFGLQFVVRRALQFWGKLARVGPNPWHVFLAILRQYTVSPLLLEPPIASEAINKEALLVILPDNYVPPEAYSELATLIWQKSAAHGVRLHVGIARFCANRPLAWWGKIDARANVSALQKKIDQPLDVILMGMGRATETILDAAPHTALIRYGSLRGLPSLYLYPKPCLTIVGDQDRQVPFVDLASLLDDLECGTAHDFPENVPLPKPVLLLPGLNHTCLVEPAKARAYMRRQNDLCLTNGITRETALDQVACVVSNFIRIILGDEAREWTELSKLSNTAVRRLQPYRALYRRRAMAEFVAQVQQHICDNVTNLPPISVHFASDFSDFAYSKPLIGRDFVRVTAAEQFPLHINGEAISISKTWAIKCKSRKAMCDAFDCGTLGGLEDDFGSVVGVFQELNRRTFAFVLEQVVTLEERSRFISSGVRLEFSCDEQLMQRSALDWLFAGLMAEENPANNTITVASPVGYTTSSSTLPVKFLGMHYGKVLTPAQCYEWIVSASWRFEKRLISETNLPPVGFFLSHHAVAPSVWNEIRDWLDVDLTKPDVGLDFSSLKGRTIPWETFTLSQNRPVAQFGFRYDYERDRVDVDTPAPPIPMVLKQLLCQMPERNDLPPTDFFTQCIINLYGPNSTSHIPWHKDDDSFGPVIVVYTFGECRPLKMRRVDTGGKGNNYTHYTAMPRHLSCYVLSQDAREVWEHSVPTGCGWRISITFRSHRHASHS